jgi:hypothetical protein
MTDLWENGRLGSGRPPLEVRRADLAPLLEAKQTPHNQDGGSSQPREPPPGSRTVACQSCEPGPTAAANGARRHAEAPGGRSGPQGADRATPRADPDEAGRGRPPAPWMRKTIWESREAGGRRKEERWGLAAAFLAATRTSGNRSGGDEGAAAHGGSCLPLNLGGGGDLGQYMWSLLFCR